MIAFRESGQNQEYKVRLGHDHGGIPTQGIMYRQNAPHVWLRFSIPKFGGAEYYGTKMSERFFIPIEPEAFADLAREMIKADPQAAIRAFGKAMQEIEISALDTDQAAPA